MKRTFAHLKATDNFFTSNVRDDTTVRTNPRGSNPKREGHRHYVTVDFYRLGHPDIKIMFCHLKTTSPKSSKTVVKVGLGSSIGLVGWLVDLSDLKPIDPCVLNTMDEVSARRSLFYGV